MENDFQNLKMFPTTPYKNTPARPPARLPTCPPEQELRLYYTMPDLRGLRAGREDTPNDDALPAGYVPKAPIWISISGSTRARYIDAQTYMCQT